MHPHLTEADQNPIADDLAVRDDGFMAAQPMLYSLAPGYRRPDWKSAAEGVIRSLESGDPARKTGAIGRADFEDLAASMLVQWCRRRSEPPVGR